MKAIASASETNKILKEHNLHAKKHLGQNFIVDPSIVEKIAKAAVISDHCVVIEVGPGIGALSEFLCRYAKKVVAYEVDPHLEAVLKETMADYDNFECIIQDFLSVDIKAVVDRFIVQGYDVVVAANLPYYITTPILFRLFEAQANIKRISVMMQKEVAARFQAKCNESTYSALSIITQYITECNVLMRVNKRAFKPVPKIDSCVLQFTLKATAKANNEKLFMLVKACFKQRRKTMLNNMKAFINDKEVAIKILNKAEIAPESRAQNLPTEAFLKIVEVIENAN